MKKRYIILGILILTFILMTTLVITNNIGEFDNFIYNSLISSRSKILDLYFKTITKCANTVTIMIVVIILLMKLKREDGILLGISTISSVIVNTIIKNIIRRPRPAHLRLIKQGGYSFPSGHAMISICVYGLLIYLITKNIKDKKLKVVSIILLVLLITSIGLSRIYVGVHYPSDVLAGYALASSMLIMIITIYNKFRGNKNDKVDCK